MPNPTPTSGRIRVPVSKVPKENRKPATGAAPAPSRAQLELQKFREMQRQARAMTELNEALLGADKDLHAHATELGKDWRNAEPNFETAAGDVKNYWSGALTIPEGRAEFDRLFDQLFIPRRVAVRNKATADEVAHHRQTLAAAAEFYANLARTAETDFDREHARQKFERAVHNAERGGFLRKEQVDPVLEDFDRRSASGGPLVIVKADSPQGAEAPDASATDSLIGFEKSRDRVTTVRSQSDARSATPTNRSPRDTGLEQTLKEEAEERRRKRESGLDGAELDEGIEKTRQSMLESEDPGWAAMAGHNATVKEAYYRYRRTGDPLEPPRESDEWRYWAANRIYSRIRGEGFSDAVARAVILNTLAESEINMSRNEKDELSFGPFQIKLNRTFDEHGKAVHTLGTMAMDAGILKEPDRLLHDLDYNLDILIWGMRQVPDLDHADSVEFATLKLVKDVFRPTEIPEEKDPNFWPQVEKVTKERLNKIREAEHCRYFENLPAVDVMDPSDKWKHLSPVSPNWGGC
jgi:hypothetical protein